MTSIAQERARLAAVGWRLRTREQWGSRYNYTNSRPVTEPASRVFVHISVTSPGTYSSDDAHARAIENIGISRFPATGISYNRLIFQSGAAYEGQPIGRRGAHTGAYTGNCAESGCPNRGGNVTSSNHNVTGRGYVICQNVQHPVTDKQFDALARSIAADMLAGFVARTAPIHGHRCVSDKSCPGPLMWGRMGALEILVNHYLRTGLGDDMSATGPASWDTADWKAFDDKGVTAFWFRDISPGSEVVNTAWSTLWNVHEMVEDLTTVPPGSTVVSGLTNEALAMIATAVADEQHRRLSA